MTSQLSYKNIAQPRDDYFAINPVSGLGEKFLLLERTHYWTINNTDQWFPGTGGSISAASLLFAAVSSYANAGPDGQNNAVAIVADTNNVYHQFRIEPLYGNGNYLGVPGEAANGQWGFNIILKAGTISQVDIQVMNDAGSFVDYRFDLSTGTFVSGPNNKVRIAPIGAGTPTYAGWYLIYSAGLRISASLGTFDLRPKVRMVKAGNQSFLGTATETILCAGFNVEYNVGLCSLPKISKPASELWGKSDGEDHLFILMPATIQEPQPLTVYMEWLDRGNAAMAAASANATTPGIFRIGNLTNTGNNYLKVTQTATGFSGIYNNGGSTSTSNVTITVDADNLVSLRAVLNAAGALSINASVNGGAEVAGTTGTAIGFPAAWGDKFITPNSHGLSNVGDMALRKMHVLPRTVNIDALRIF